MRKKGLWKKTASVLIAAAMIMTSVPVYAGPSDEIEDGVIVQESTEDTESEVIVQESTENAVGENMEDDTSADEGSSGTLIGKGTQEAPYLIATLDALKQFVTISNEAYDKNQKLYVKLTDNIDLEGSASNPWTEFKFTGTFDGDNHTISNLYVNGGTEGSGFGFFGNVKQSEVKNLKIHNATVMGNSAIGAVAGEAFVVKFENCHVEGLINIGVTTDQGYLPNYNSSYIGGIAGHGYINASGCTVTGSDNSIICGGRQIGGIVGFNSEGNNTIDGCRVSNIELKGVYGVAGILGWAHYDNIVQNNIVDTITLTNTNNSTSASKTNQKYATGYIVGTNYDDRHTFLNNTATNSNSNLEVTYLYSSYYNDAYATDGSQYCMTEEFQTALNKKLPNVVLLFDVKGNYTVDAEQDLVLDLNGRKITATDLNSPAIANNGNGNLKITNGTIVGEVDKDKITLENVEVIAPTYIAMIGDKKYATIAKALVAAQENDVIKLVADSSSVSMSGKKVTLDLNGHTITGSTYGVNVSTESDLTIIDSSTEKTGMICATSTNDKYSSYGSGIRFTSNSAKVTLGDVNISASKNGVYDEDGGTLVVENASISGSKNAIYSSESGASVTINGGKFKGLMDCSSGNITGGVFTDATNVEKVCASGYHCFSLSSDDERYQEGYKYEVRQEEREKNVQTNLIRIDKSTVEVTLPEICPGATYGIPSVAENSKIGVKAGSDNGKLLVVNNGIDTADSITFAVPVILGEAKHYDITVTINVIDAPPIAPLKGEGYTISYNENHQPVITIKTDYEVSASVDFASTILDGILGANHTYYIRKVANGNIPASNATAFVVPEAPQVSVNVISSNPNAGTVQVTGGTQGKYYEGDIITIEAVSKAGYKFNGWYKNGSIIEGAAAEYTLTLNENVNLEAKFVVDNEKVVMIPTSISKKYEAENENAYNLNSLVTSESHYTVATNKEITGAGTYTITATLGNGYVWEDGSTGTKTFTYTVTKAENENVPAVSANGTSITGVAAGMEYRKSTEPTYTDVPTVISGLEPGTYYVRYKGNENTKPGKDVVIIIKASVTTLTVKSVGTNSAILDGTKDSGISEELTYEYRVLGSETWTSSSDKLTDLMENTDYEYRAVAGGWTGDILTFRTLNAAAPVGSIGVGISGSNDTIVTVMVEEGKTTIASTSGTISSGKANISFEHLPDGYYNIVLKAVKDNYTYTETRMLSVKDGNAVTTEFVIPTGNISSVVEVANNTPSVAVDGLADIISSDDIQKAGANVIDVEVKLEVEQNENAEGSLEIKEISEKKTVDTILDMSLYKTTTTISDQSTIREDIGSDNKVVLEVAIPYITSGKDISVYRYHDGIAEELKALNIRPSGNFVDGTYYVDNGYIFVYASGFSTYAVAYKNQPTNPGGGTIVEPSISTSDSTTQGIEVGESKQLHVTVTGTNEDVKWISSNSEIVNVTSNGMITGISAGTATITASVNGKSISFTITVLNKDASLSGLTISEGTLSPEFYAENEQYKAVVENAVDSILVTPKTTDEKSTVTVNGKPASEKVALKVGYNTINVVVTAEDGKTTKTYTIQVTRAVPKNKTITISRRKYKVTNELISKASVQITGLSDKKVINLSVPDTVKIYGITYKVTSVGKNAFRGQPKMKTAKIGNNVTTVGYGAFYACPLLNSVTLGTKVKTIGDHVFCRDSKLRTLTLQGTALTKVEKNVLYKVTGLTIKAPSSKVKAYKKLFTNKGAKNFKVVKK